MHARLHQAVASISQSTVLFAVCCRLHGDCIALSASSASLRDFRDPDPNMPQTRSQSFCDVLSASSSSIASLMHSELR